MTTEFHSCAPNGGINEDLVRVIEGDACIDLVVLDGATSVADTDYIDAHRGDVAWFTHAFAAQLEAAIGRGLGQAAAVREALVPVRAQYADAIGGRTVPLCAHPLAALSWIRILPRADRLEVSLYCLGDCKVLAIAADGSVVDLDPYVNAHEDVLRAAMTALTEEGVVDPAQRRARLLPMLRARRESQHGASAPDVLCLAPRGEFAARHVTVQLPPGTAVLGMTDGFYRLVDVYGLLTPEALGRRCRDEGVAALMRELRQFEQAAAGGALALKSADDASAVLWQDAAAGRTRQARPASVRA